MSTDPSPAPHSLALPSPLAQVHFFTFVAVIHPSACWLFVLRAPSPSLAPGWLTGYFQAGLQPSLSNSSVRTQWSNHCPGPHAWVSFSWLSQSSDWCVSPLHSTPPAGPADRPSGGSVGETREDCWCWFLAAKYSRCGWLNSVQRNAAAPSFLHRGPWHLLVLFPPVGNNSFIFILSV